MKAAFLALASLALLTACKPGPHTPQVRQAWVRLPAVAGGPAAAYFMIQGGRRDARLVQVESALAKRAELHESMAGAEGMMRMAPLESVDVPAGGQVAFAPAGRHVMLFGLDPLVKPGTAVPLRFGFADGTTAEAEAKSVGAGGDAPY